MARILIRNLDDTVIERLKRRAAQNGRSLQAEVKMLLEQAAQIDMASAREMAAQIRQKSKGRLLSDSVELLREERYG
jgi:plasmid stability protein